MHTYLRTKPAWMQLMIFGGLTIGIFLIVILVGFSILAQLNHLSSTQIRMLTPADFAKPEFSSLIRGMLIVQFFIFFLPSMIFAYLADPNPLYYSGFRRPQKMYFLLLAIILIIIAYLTVEFLAMINESIVHVMPANVQKWVLSGEEDANGPLGNVLTMKSPADLIYTVFLVGLLPAVGEELFFRGILQRLFIQVFKKAWPGIIFTSFLFSAFHMQFMGFLPRMALGVVLGSIYWYSGSLYASILGHFFFNTINVLFIYWKVADLDSKTSYSLGFAALGIVSIVVVSFLINYLRKKSVTSYATEFPIYSEPTIFDDPDQSA